MDPVFLHSRHCCWMYVYVDTGKDAARSIAAAVLYVPTLVRSKVEEDCVDGVCQNRA
jgi:hypothetical protein